jgi:hypothetical protein
VRTTARSTHRRLAGAAIAVTAAAALIPAVVPPAAARHGDGDPAGGLLLTQVQAMATHNSYHREASFAEQRLMGARDPDFATLLYSHASLPAQLTRERVRGVELDVFPDPRGGLYARPLIRTEAGLPPLRDPALRGPGFKVMHWADFDYRSSCLTLTRCLNRIRTWSARHPSHVAVPVLLELKQTDPELEARGGAESPPWNTGRLDALDAAIRTVFPARQTVTPDDVRRPGLSLETSVRTSGWPSVARTRGEVMFLMDNNDQKLQDAYRAGGRQSLQGRVLFTNSRPGRPDAAFVEVNDPTGAGKAAIQHLVRQGYFVRTRSDEPLKEARTGDTARLRDALASGAQMISTDFPAPGLAARYGSDYTAELPRAGGPVRCDPVTARAPACPAGPLEPSSRDR